MVNCPHLGNATFLGLVLQNGVCGDAWRRPPRFHVSSDETKMNPGICEVTHDQHARLTEVWEASVRATHEFLGEADIAHLRPRILHEYLSAVTLRAYRDAQGRLQGFIGISAQKIEMLFISPECRGQGIGKQLVAHAVSRFGVAEVDVNEQNPQAIGFYERMGFRTFDRSARDGLGKPFPLLHMRLAQA